MTINNTDIAEYGARLLEYSVGGTEITRVTGNAYSANIPKLFHTDFGQRQITVTIVFRPKFQQYDGIVAKLHSLALQKSAFDAKISNGVAEILLPDDFYYRCILTSTGSEVTDGESLEVTYTLSGIRHKPLVKIKGKTIQCASTVKTDCKITATVGAKWIEGTMMALLINHLTEDYNSFLIKNLKAGDTVVIDGMNCTVTKNGQNIFGDTNIIIFPYLRPGKNEFEEMTGQDCTFVTEYYPTFI